MTAPAGQSVTAAPIRPPGRSPLRLLVTFLAALGVVLLIVGAAAIALAPPAAAPDCPESDGVCGGPPVPPTLPPASSVAGRPPATQAPVATPAAASAPATAAPATAAPAPTVAGQTASPTPAPPTALPSAPGSPPPSEAPSVPQPTTAPPSPTATPATAFVVPAPRPASEAAPFRAGAVWRSSEYGFSFEYDDEIWTIREESGRGVYMLAARGQVALSIGAFAAGDRQPDDLFRDEIARLEGLILGFIEEPDPDLQLPGVANIGYRIGSGGAFAGTVNSPQGPTTNVSAAVLTAGDDRITVLVTLLTPTQLRAPAFSVVDSMLNTFRWSDPGQ